MCWGEIPIYPTLVILFESVGRCRLSVETAEFIARERHSRLKTNNTGVKISVENEGENWGGGVSGGEERERDLQKMTKTQKRTDKHDKERTRESKIAKLR